jgi:excisionase family DNA binding protein
MNEVYLTELEVSEKTKISLATLRRWRLENRGPRYRKFGSLVRYNEDDLSDWMEAQPSGGSALPCIQAAASQKVSRSVSSPAIENSTKPFWRSLRLSLDSPLIPRAGKRIHIANAEAYKLNELP